MARWAIACWSIAPVDGYPPNGVQWRFHCELENAGGAWVIRNPNGRQVTVTLKHIVQTIAGDTAALMIVTLAPGETKRLGCSGIEPSRQSYEVSRLNIEVCDKREACQTGWRWT